MMQRQPELRAAVATACCKLLYNPKAVTSIIRAVCSKTRNFPNRRNIPLYLYL